MEQDESRVVIATDAKDAAKEEDPQGRTLASLMRLLLAESGYEEMVRNEGEESNRWRNIGDLATLASERRVSELDEFLDQIALVSDVDALDAQGTAAGALARRRAVQLSTIHGAKGLEFDLVFVAGCEEGLLPHYYCTENEEEVEQERRLLYVAMTRAKERLVLTHTGVRARWGTVTPVERSRFLQDLPTDLCVQAEPRWRRPRWNGGSNAGQGSGWRRERSATAK